MKEHIKHAAKSFWSGFTSAIPDALRYMRDHPRPVCLTVLMALAIALLASIKGLLLFITIIGSIAAMVLTVVYLFGCAVANTWKPWT